MSNSLKKRVVVGFVFACIGLFAAGCSSQSQGETVNVPSNEQDSPKTEEKPTEFVDQEDETTAAIQISKTTYQNGNISVHFPQLSGMENTTLETQINERLKHEVIQFINQYEDAEATLDLDYLVKTETEDALSILYTGYYNVSEGMYPTQLLFTTNIDLRSGEKRRLTDFTTINESFVEKFKTAPYIDWEDPTSPNEEKMRANQEYLSDINNAVLLKALQQADLATNVENPQGIYSYFEENDLIISIQVPHVIGDHAEFKMQLE